MQKTQLIIARYVHDSITMDNKGKYIVQIAGISDNKPMKYQVWEIPFETSKEATKVINEYTEKLNNPSKSFLVFINKGNK